MMTVPVGAIDLGAELEGADGWEESMEIIADLKPSFEQIAADHRELCTTLGGINELTHRLSDPASQTRLAFGLGRLDRLLTRHYRTEEASELYTEIPWAYPRLVGTLTRLQAEHDRLLNALRKLRAGYHLAEDVPARLAVEIRAFVRVLQRHEQAESEIMQRIHYEDIGVSG